MKCRVCEQESATPTCSPECAELNARLVEKNRRQRRDEVQPEEFAPAIDRRTVVDEPQEACVLYGVLTESDVRELERRRWLFEQRKPVLVEVA